MEQLQIIQLEKLFDEIININLDNIVISGFRGNDGAAKIKIRPVVLKNMLKFQVTRYVETKVLHTNYDDKELKENMRVWMTEEYKQMQVHTRSDEITVLVSKKGKVTIKRKRLAGQVGSGVKSAGAAAGGGASGVKSAGAAASGGASGATPAGTAAGDGVGKCSAVSVIESAGASACNSAIDPFAMIASHNRQKRYILQEGIPVDFLVDLGVMTPEGKVIRSRYDKFRQINRFLEFIEDILPQLPKDRQVHIIDFGCGKSYLTFAMYYYLKQLQGYDIAITGLDLKKDVIEKCNALACRYGYEHLEFLHGDIADYEGTDSVDMVVTLHACDTATDYALYKAVRWNARVILSVPCCQHELNRQIECEDMSAVLQYGLLKERMSALFTDGMRAELLNAAGYKTQILEFIDMEHTPKNILIRAVRESAVKKIQLTRNYEQCKRLIHAAPLLEKLLAGLELGR